jgi:hypothetical protein
MLFEYAVEPQAIGSSWQTFLYLIEKFGFDRGRLISQLPGKWEKKVIQAAKQAGVPDIRMASIVERLRNAKLWVVDFGRPYDSEKSWIDNALTEHQRAPSTRSLPKRILAGTLPYCLWLISMNATR